MKIGDKVLVPNYEDGYADGVEIYREKYEK